MQKHVSKEWRHRIGFPGGEHRRASNREQARRALFNGSFPPCQALISAREDCPMEAKTAPRRRVLTSHNTECTSGLPEKKASRLAMTQSCIATCDSMVWPPT